MMIFMQRRKTWLDSVAFHVTLVMIAISNSWAGEVGKEGIQSDFKTLHESIHMMIDTRNTSEHLELSKKQIDLIDAMAMKLKSGDYRMDDLEAEIKKGGKSAQKLQDEEKTGGNAIKAAELTVYADHLFTVMFKADKKRLLQFIETNLENESLSKYIIKDALSLVGIRNREAIGKKKNGYKDEELLPCFLKALQSDRREIRNYAFMELVDEDSITGKPLGKAEAIQAMKEIVVRKDVPFERIEPYYELLSEVGECRDEYIKKMEGYVSDKKNPMVQRYDYYHKLKKLGVDAVDPFKDK